MKKIHNAFTNYIFRALASTLTRHFIKLASYHQPDDLFRKMHHFVQPGVLLRQPGESLRQPRASLRQPGVLLLQPGATGKQKVNALNTVRYSIALSLSI